MTIQKIKSFAKFARHNLVKTKIISDYIKEGYINMLLNGYCDFHGIDMCYDDSIIPLNIKQKFSADILSADVFDGENLCWLYQYFVYSDRKNAVDAISGLEIQSEEITASTQVFTPDWIVKYMVDNSLGVFSSQNLPYRINGKQTNKDVKEITFIDPACGCGNILCYAFDLFIKLYKQQGICENDSASLILKNNIFGADIDKFAVKVCNFLLLAKAYQYDKDIFSKNILANIFVVDDDEKIGSLKDIPCDKKQFTVVCTNPPYLSRMSKPLKEFLNKNMKPYSKDLFTAFMYKGLKYTEKQGYMAYMTPNAWLYLSSHKNIREYILSKNISSLIELKKGSYFSEASVDICAFVIHNTSANEGTYIKLDTKEKGLKGQQMALINAIKDINDGNPNKCVYLKNQTEFLQHKEKLILYNAPDCIYNLFKNKTIGDTFTVKQGMTTGNNKKFLRYWWEVPYSQIGFGFDSAKAAAKSGYKWFPYNKGGKYQKWYGNNHYVVMYENDGKELKEYTSHLPQGTWVRLKSREYYFKPSITWSFISSTRFGVRYSPKGSIFDVAGSSLFTEDYEYVLGFLSSSTAFYLLQLINPTMNYQIRDIKALPFIEDESIKPRIAELVNECVDIAKEDWDSFETSYGFIESPLLAFKGMPLEKAISQYIRQRSEQKNLLIQNEREINLCFAKLYNLENQVDITPDRVSIKDIDEKDIISDLLSYAVKLYFKNNMCECVSVSDIAEFSKQFTEDNFISYDYAEKVIGTDIESYFTKDFIKDHKKKYFNKPIYDKKKDVIHFTNL